MIDEELIGEKIDRLYELRNKANKLLRDGKKLKKSCTELESEIVNQLRHDELTGARGRIANFSMASENVPNVTDWPSVYDYIKDSNDFSILKKSVNSLVWRELLESGELIPGTEKIEITKTSLRKI
jgi:hypothetical protein